MLYGITPWHVRILCENHMEGGRGYTPREVGDMTVDQIYMLCCNKKILRSHRQDKVSAFEAVQEISPDDEGRYKGRDKDGKPMKARIAGESVAARLTREQEERERQSGT